MSEFFWGLRGLDRWGLRGFQPLVFLGLSYLFHYRSRLSSLSHFLLSSSLFFSRPFPGRCFPLCTRISRTGQDHTESGGESVAAEGAHQSTNDELTDERQVWTRGFQSELGGGGVSGQEFLQFWSRSSWQSRCVLRGCVGVRVMLTSSHRFCLLRPPVTKCNQFSQNFRIFALSRGLPQKIRAERPSNGNAERLRTKNPS